MGGRAVHRRGYYLYKVENERDYGGEAIEILLQVMENNRDDLVVVLAGYADRMDTFFAANRHAEPDRAPHHVPGLHRRRAGRIGELMAVRLGYRFSPEAREVLDRYLRAGSAAVVRQRAQRAQRRRAARLRQARRLLELPDPRVDLAR